MLKIYLIALCNVLIMLCSSFAAVAVPVGIGKGKKIIEFGWDEPDTKFMRENIETMEKIPFDGTVFHVLCYRNGKPINFAWSQWGKEKFELKEFQHAIDDLKNTKFKRFTDNFLRLNVVPGDVDWFDDKEWSVVLNNVAVTAQIAKQGRCKGILFDVEQYQFPLFNYLSQKHKDTKTFPEYQKQVRKRGREFIREINRHFPDITIMLTFGYSLAQSGAPEGDRSRAHYGLLADFLDGILEACSPKTEIVDGWEFSYPYKTYQQFRQAYETIKRKSLKWTALPNRYKKHFRAGFGLWMDYDWRGIGWHPDDFSKNHFTPKEFEYALFCALRTCDKYVWVYTEQPKWWTNEKLPKEYLEALSNARQPHQIVDELSRHSNPRP